VSTCPCDVCPCGAASLQSNVVCSAPSLAGSALLDPSPRLQNKQCFLMATTLARLQDSLRWQTGAVSPGLVTVKLESITVRVTARITQGCSQACAHPEPGQRLRRCAGRYR